MQQGFSVLTFTVQNNELNNSGIVVKTRAENILHLVEFTFESWCQKKWYGKCIIFLKYSFKLMT